MRPGPVRGFTLVELMITVAVLAIVCAIAFPSFEGVMRSNRLATTTNEMIASLSLARSEAIRSAHPASICGSDDGSACSDDWEGGWLVWDDADGNGEIDDEERIVRFSKANAKMSVAGPEGGVITFDGRGRRAGNDAQAVVLKAKDCNGDNLQITLAVSPTGRADVSERQSCT
ncbi:GspH/FimT family pseudopilin [Luteimonas aquatica]|uniref:GspH/FimT family pseudopilin n=1 Tax=Luteimonas aquatica TaxID=450364 RepID=UPI001F5A0A7F|nr:Tfp pilus assembly protein FimT/FimU [Luteimonas aquatica]